METNKCNNCSVDVGDDFFGTGKNGEMLLRGMLLLTLGISRYGLRIRP
jgi:hypothetical protein